MKELLPVGTGKVTPVISPDRKAVLNNYLHHHPLMTNKKYTASLNKLEEQPRAVADRHTFLQTNPLGKNMKKVPLIND